MIRMYAQEPHFTLLWSFKLSGSRPSVAWSSSNRFAASCFKGNTYIVRVWNSAFQTVFKRRRKQKMLGYYDLTFASNNLLLSSGSDLSWYHLPIAKRTVMKLFIEKTALPFCRDVLKIILTYLPVQIPDPPASAQLVSAVIALSSQMIATIVRNEIRLYKVHGSTVSLIKSLPYQYCSTTVAVCCYRHSDDESETGFVLASCEKWGNRAEISVLRSAPASQSVKESRIYRLLQSRKHKTQS